VVSEVTVWDRRNGRNRTASASISAPVRGAWCALTSAEP